MPRMRARATFTEGLVAPTLRAMTTKHGDDWNVLPHGPIEKLAENLWWVQGSLRGMSLTAVVAPAQDTPRSVPDIGSRRNFVVIP